MCFGLIATGIIIVAGLYENKGMHYWIEFEESVLGVTEGGVVEYLGVPVGRVDRISVTYENRAFVEIVVDPEKVMLRDGVEAQLVIYSLAAGTMAISLSGGESGLPLPQGTQIPTKVSTIQAVSSQIEEVMASLNSIAGVINSSLAGMEEGAMTDMLDKVALLLEDGRGFLDKGGKLADEATLTVADLRGKTETLESHFIEISEKIQGLTDDLSALTKDARVKINEFDVSETQNELNRALTNVADISGQVSEAVANLSTATDSTLHEVDNIQHSLDRTLRDLGLALDSLSYLARQLQDDPSSLVRGKGKVRKEK